MASGSSGFCLAANAWTAIDIRRSLRVLDGLQNFEANGFQGLTDNSNVVEKGRERTNTRQGNLLPPAHAAPSGQSNRVIANCKDCPHPPFQTNSTYEHLIKNLAGQDVAQCCLQNTASPCFQSMGLNIDGDSQVGAGSGWSASPWRALWGRWRGNGWA